MIHNFQNAKFELIVAWTSTNVTQKKWKCLICNKITKISTPLEKLKEDWSNITVIAKCFRARLCENVA